ncbi:hypothetical protein K470DRAFT_263643 [Piedraia hortae CBS 480.64]|uniref:Uncharacterized protein n=1 Tax=Piedraia hortae CBS 480.64 TaxID=1314780 RepID=A0A6A7C2B4_9PEZI|nr:hypothetical protein K470DRAFT_263643 [Piedraia hortae CBS 480.64]
MRIRASWEFGCLNPCCDASTSPPLTLGPPTPSSSGSDSSSHTSPPSAVGPQVLPAWAEFADHLDCYVDDMVHRRHRTRKPAAALPQGRMPIGTWNSHPVRCSEDGLRPGSSSAAAPSDNDDNTSLSSSPGGVRLWNDQPDAADDHDVGYQQISYPVNRLHDGLSPVSLGHTPGLHSVAQDDGPVIYGNKVVGPEYVKAKHGKANGEVQFAVHRNGDISAQQWSQARGLWEIIGQYSYARQRTEGQLAADRLKGETTVHALQKDSFPYFCAVAKQRELVASGNTSLDFTALLDASLHKYTYMEPSGKEEPHPQPLVGNHGAERQRFNQSSAQESVGAWRLPIPQHNLSNSFAFASRFNNPYPSSDYGYMNGTIGYQRETPIYGDAVPDSAARLRCQAPVWMSTNSNSAFNPQMLSNVRGDMVKHIAERTHMRSHGLLAEEQPKTYSQNMQSPLVLMGESPSRNSSYIATPFRGHRPANLFSAQQVPDPYGTPQHNQVQYAQTPSPIASFNQQDLKKTVANPSGVVPPREYGNESQYPVQHHMYTARNMGTGPFANKKSKTVAEMGVVGGHVFVTNQGRTTEQKEPEPKVELIKPFSNEPIRTIEELDDELLRGWKPKISRHDDPHLWSEFHDKLVADYKAGLPKDQKYENYDLFSAACRKKTSQWHDSLYERVLEGAKLMGDHSGIIYLPSAENGREPVSVTRSVLPFFENMVHYHAKIPGYGDNWGTAPQCAIDLSPTGNHSFFGDAAQKTTDVKTDNGHPEDAGAEANTSMEDAETKVNMWLTGTLGGTKSKAAMGKAPNRRQRD